MLGVSSRAQLCLCSQKRSDHLPYINQYKVGFLGRKGAALLREAKERKTFINCKILIIYFLALNTGHFADCCTCSSNIVTSACSRRCYDQHYLKIRSFEWPRITVFSRLFLVKNCKHVLQKYTIFSHLQTVHHLPSLSLCILFRKCFRSLKFQKWCLISLALL